MKEYSPKEADRESILGLRTIYPNKFINGQKEARPRFCLKCFEPFISEGHHNRLCDKCRGYNSRTVQLVPLSQADSPTGVSRGRRYFAKKIYDGY